MESIFQASNMDISSVIQLAIAPVFLLAGIGGSLSVMTTRLGRIVDRGRLLNDRLAQADEQQLEQINAELVILYRRAKLTNKAISLCTTSALFICLVIVVLFINVLFELHVGIIIAFLFLVSILSLIAAYLLFLREVGLSTSTFRFRGHARR
ncbi:DUF2721 domain-containing protein [Gammaproteobacteria bacterium]|nr:DUF2721 domain-containing protein [Gammaproteobacteria bacterium]